MQNSHKINIVAKFVGLFSGPWGFALLCEWLMFKSRTEFNASQLLNIKTTARTIF